MIATEEGLALFLKADPAIAALAGDRIEPQTNTQATAHPRMTYQRISTPRVRHLRGRSRLAHPRVQVSCFALSYSEVKQLAKAVADCVEDTAKYGQISAGWPIAGMWIEDERDHYFDDQHGADVGVHEVSLDIVIWHNEV